MFGFFKRRDDGVTPVVPGTPVDRVSFTAREIFAILGDGDACYFICNTTTMELLRRALVRPDEWRRRAVERLAPAGIVDDACNPCPELERLLEPLRTRGVEISDGAIPLPGDSRDKRTFCLQGDYARATLIRSIGDGFQRTFTLSDAGPREGWWPLVSSAARIPAIAPSPQPECIPFLESDPACDGFADALADCDADVLRAFAERWGVNFERLVGTSSMISSSKHLLSSMVALRLIDATDGDVVLNRVGTFTMHKLIGGNMYVADSCLFPSLGFSLTGHRCRRIGMPENWYDDDSSFKASAFGSIDWLGDGDLVAHLMSNPPFPEHLTTPWRPAVER
ncbi:MAG: hypothetical protein E7001_00085 [Coriobacteriaceae bacterium]|nr:hypothetical protein [Coriobacteriaceae bacterium]